MNKWSFIMALAFIGLVASKDVYFEERFEGKNIFFVI